MIYIFLFSNFSNINLTSHWESDEVGSQTKSGSLAGCNTNAGRNEVEEDENAGSSDTEREDLTHIELGLGDEHSGEGYSETFDEVFNNTGDEIREETVHLLISLAKKKYSARYKA
jgi:hypothetical protein